MTPAKPAVVAPQPGDPDYGMVTSAPGTTTDAALTRRSWNPDDGMVNYVPSDPNELAAGTNIRVRLSQDLSTTEAHPGEAFRAVVDRDVSKEGRVIIPAGAELRGHVVGVSQGHHLGPHATIRLRPEMVMLPDGHGVSPLRGGGAVEGARDSHHGRGGIAASPHYKKDAIEYGAGTGAGAVAGRRDCRPGGRGCGIAGGRGCGDGTHADGEARGSQPAAGINAGCSA